MYQLPGTPPPPRPRTLFQSFPGLEAGFAVMFDAMGALSTKYNDTPETASRAFDQTRDGFVIAGGGGIKDTNE